MRIYLLLSLLVLHVSAFSQTIIEANPGEYHEAKNYGGKVELKRFLQNEMNYPEEALAKGEQGVVVLEFIVDKETGKTKQLKVKEPVSPSLDKEAMRLHRLLLYSPSQYLGDRVTTYSTLKIKFSPAIYKRYCKKRGYESVVYSADMDTSTRIYMENQVDIKPKMFFADSLDNIATFLTKNLQYPEGTRKLNITGTVVLSFVVEPSGRITNIKVKKGVGGGATNETERLLKLLSWTPGEKDGQKVRVTWTFEVSYRLTNN